MTQRTPSGMEGERLGKCLLSGRQPSTAVTSGGGPIQHPRPTTRARHASSQRVPDAIKRSHNNIAGSWLDVTGGCTSTLPSM